MTPGVLSPNFFRDLGAYVAEANGPPSRERVREIMRSHGLALAD